MVILFSNYYRHEYVIKSNEKKRIKKEANETVTAKKEEIAEKSLKKKK